MVEAVTGSGKTLLGITAVRTALTQGRRVLVVVPGIELQRQWTAALTRHVPRLAVGRLGDGHTDDLSTHLVVVAVVNSASAKTGLLPEGTAGLLIADECHRYAATAFAKALDPAFDWRLGLTATYERDDAAHVQILDPYFGGVVFRLWYDRALADDVIAPFDIILVGVDLSARERVEYEEHTETLDTVGWRLESRYGIARRPFAAFMTTLNELADGDRRVPQVAAARRYLAAWSRRRALLAGTQVKQQALAALAPAVRSAQGVLVFTQTQESALTSVELLTSMGCEATAVHSGLSSDERKDSLDRFSRGTLSALAAPRVLDEGIDVPEADLGIMLAANRSRRQLVQRLGRVIRKKADGRPGRFVVLYAKNTVEDPAVTGDVHLSAALPYARNVDFLELPEDFDALLTALGVQPSPIGTTSPDRSPPTVRQVSAPTHSKVKTASSSRLSTPAKAPRAPHPHTPAIIDPSGGGGDEDDGEPAPRLNTPGATADPVKDYLKNIGRVQLLTAEQEVDLAERIEAGVLAEERLEGGGSLSERLERELWWLVEDSHSARRQLIEANLRLVVSLAKRYTGRGVPFLDLIQEGNLGLMRAVQGFDHREGNKFSTYATWWIRQSLTRAVHNQSRTIRVPVHAHEKLDAMRSATRTWQPEEVTAERVAEACDLSVNEARELLALRRPMWSLDHLIDDHGGALDVVSIDSCEIDLFVDRLTMADWATQALDTLGPRAARVMRLRHGFEDGRPRTLDEIGREFGVTRERIRQIESEALSTLAGIVERP